MDLDADVIVMPALSVRDEHQVSAFIGWIKNHFASSTKILAICDGTSTGDSTGLYYGKPITAHVSDFDAIKPHFNKPLWVQDVTVTKAGNLFSTVDVSNAAEGSLLGIEELFGYETARKVATDIITNCFLPGIQRCGPSFGKVLKKLLV